MEKLIDKITKCELCELSKYRKNVVPGEGPSDAQIMIVGEGPGEMNDLYGRPFIGRGGVILDSCLLEANLDRDKLFLTNIIKCRMPHNATPTNKIVSICSRYIEEQINLIKPKVIVALGLAASKYFLKDKSIKLSDLIDKKIIYRNSLLLCTYHPSSIRYNKNAKDCIIKTLRLAKKLTEE